jgi:hypothetical protein
MMPGSLSERVEKGGLVLAHGVAAAMSGTYVDVYVRWLSACARRLYVPRKTRMFDVDIYLLLG